MDGNNLWLYWTQLKSRVLDWGSWIQLKVVGGGGGAITCAYTGLDSTKKLGGVGPEHGRWGGEITFSYTELNWKKFVSGGVLNSTESRWGWGGEAVGKEANYGWKSTDPREKEKKKAFWNMEFCISAQGLLPSIHAPMYLWYRPKKGTQFNTWVRIWNTSTYALHRQMNNSKWPGSQPD